MEIARHIHLTFVGLSLLGFVIRGVMMLLDSPLLRAKLVRILPHVIDTVLIVSALVLAVKLGLKPSEQPWLMVKIVALFIYIGLGVIALKPSRPKKVRVVAWVGALVCAAFIVSAAITKSAAGFFAFF